MKKNIIKTIFIFIIYFCFINNVEAADSYSFSRPHNGSPYWSSCGVDEEGKLKGTCYSWFNTYSTANGGYNSAGFCIDIGKDVPTVDYTNVQAINPTINNISIGYSSIYKIYLYHVSSHINSNGVLTTALRQAASTAGVSLFAENKTFPTGLKNSDKYTSAAIYEQASDSVYWWKNPLKITSTVKNPDLGKDDGYYEYEIKINFKGEYNYFNDKDVGFGPSYFKYKLQINDQDIDDGLIDGNNIKVEGNSHKNIINDNTGESVKVSIKKATYDDLAEKNGGKVYVKLKYETYNVMSPSNVIIVSGPNENEQRMVVFRKNVEEGTYTTTKKFIEKTEKQCFQDKVNKLFYYEGNKVGFDTYLENCGCSKVDATSLGDLEKPIFNGKCKSTNKDDYESTLNVCKDDEKTEKAQHTDDGQNKLRHISKTSFIDGQYCDLICEEEIITDGFTNNQLSVFAGKKFLPSTPKLTANKVCNIKVDYGTWETDYEKLLDDEIEALNKLVYDEAVNDTNNTIETQVSCGNSEYTSLYEFKYNVYGIKNNSIEIVRTNVSETYGGCENRIKPRTNSLEKNQDILSIKKTNIENHFKKLNNCGNKLKEMGEKEEDFYNFNVKLNFYYNQHYITVKGNSDSNGNWNNKKLNDEPDDSNMELINGKTNKKTGDYTTNGTNDYISEGTKINYNNYEEYYNKNNVSYLYIESDTNINSTYAAGLNSDKYNEYINRQYEYKYEFRPSILKYSDVLTGQISSDKSKLSNPVNIGRVYDTDVTAKTQQEYNYYSFINLGDESSISNYYNNNGTKVQKLNEPEGIKELRRYCTYNITNKIITSKPNDNPDDNPDDKPSDNPNDYKYNVIYRVVDPNNIDPNNRLNNTDGLKNWNQNQINNANENDTFNPDKLEYSFTLDSKTIKEIREYNKKDGNSYSDKKYISCEVNVNSGENTGKKCKSKFIENASDGKEDFSTKFATNISGRDKWLDLN